ncbi:uncharacterized protein LOC135687989 isoform X2 [Rhopilema esculentum]|uniref:uncharacterized protein LOC135687989 isoform X2 n=1 Tax=Rhopilema esculentum TaxID=499914 RepID=UPI0031D4AD78
MARSRYLKTWWKKLLYISTTGKRVAVPGREQRFYTDNFETMKNFIFWISIFSLQLLLASGSAIDSNAAKNEDEPIFEDDLEQMAEEDPYEADMQHPMYLHDSIDEDLTFKDASPGWGRVVRRVVRGTRRVVRRVARGTRRVVRRVVRGTRRLVRRLANIFPQCRQSKHYRRGHHVPYGRASGSCIKQTAWHLQARCWAPKIYMAIGERFLPSSVDFFLRYVNMFNSHGRLVQTNLRTSNLLPLQRGFLGTKQRLRSATSELPFFRGQHPKFVPIYVFFKQFRRGNDVFRTFYYYVFFPYNRGKHACMGPVINNKCTTRNCRWFGNHVGDWEHVTIQLKNNYPYKMYISAHDFGGTYWYNSRIGAFAKGGDRVKFTRCGHPIVFCAKGSHGMWTKQGVHTYKKLIYGEKLDDVASAGIPWDTWKFIKLIRHKKKAGYRGTNRWLNFNGDWGNRERACFRIRLFKKQLVKQCTLNGGPSSLNNRMQSNF